MCRAGAGRCGRSGSAGGGAGGGALAWALCTSLGLMKAASDTVGMAILPEVFGTGHLGVIAGAFHGATALASSLASAPTAVVAVRGITLGGSLRCELVWLLGACAAGAGLLAVPVPRTYKEEGHSRIATSSESEPNSPHATPVLRAAAGPRS